MNPNQAKRVIANTKRSRRKAHPAKDLLTPFDLRTDIEPGLRERGVPAKAAQTLEKDRDSYQHFVRRGYLRDGFAKKVLRQLTARIQTEIVMTLPFKQRY